MKTTIIQLEEFDQIASIKDKISNSPTQRVLLVWPDSGYLNLKPLDYLVILRYAYLLDIQLACVLDDPVVVRFMKEQGISTFHSIPESNKKPWRKPKIINFINKEANNERKTRINEYLETKSSPSMKLPGFVRWIVFFVGIVAFFALIFFLIPGATINLMPDYEERSTRIPIRAQPSLEQVNITGAVPAKIVEVIVEGQMDGISTGIIRIPAEFAVGEVVFRNLSDKRIEIPTGTVVRTETDPAIRFETIEEAGLPPRFDAEIAVEVRSLIGGASGNVNPNSITTIEDDFGANLSVSNPEAIRGGIDVKTFSPTENDYALLEKSLLDELSATALEKINQEYGDDHYITEESIKLQEVVKTERIPEVGDPGERFTLALEVKYSGWALKNEDLVYLSNLVLTSEMEKGFQPDTGSTDFKVDEKTIEFKQDELNIELIASHFVYPSVDEQKILTQIVGKSRQNAVNILESEMKLKTEPTIAIFPSFWDYLPFLPLRIELVINE